MINACLFTWFCLPRWKFFLKFNIMQPVSIWLNESCEYDTVEHYWMGEKRSKGSDEKWRQEWKWRIKTRRSGKYCLLLVIPPQLSGCYNNQWSCKNPYQWLTKCLPLLGNSAFNYPHIIGYVEVDACGLWFILLCFWLQGVEWHASGISLAPSSPGSSPLVAWPFCFLVAGMWHSVS